MKPQTITPFLIPIVLAVIVLVSSAYIVDETEQVIITQFGEPKGEPVTSAGLYFKIPFIQRANYFDKRLLEWDGMPTQVPTKDKKFIWVDTFARWHIADPLKFMQAMGSEMQAQSRLDDIIEGNTRDFITAYTLNEVVRNSNRILELSPDEESVISEEGLEKVTTGREGITREILAKAQPIVAQFGIELVNIRIKRVDYVEQVRRKVFDRMIAERKRAADKLRSEGQGIKAEIAGRKEKELKRIQSEAYKEAQEIKGKADAEAVRIYAQAYSKDPEFYSFLNSLDSYKKSLSGKTKLIIGTDNEYFQYLKEIEATQ